MSDRPYQVQVHPTQPPRHDIGGKGRQNGPSASQVLAVIILLPVSGTLLLLAGITLVGSLIGLAVTTPLFIIFSPVIIPAVITIGIAVTGFLSSGAFGLTGLSSLSWLLNYFRQVADHMPEQLDHAKKRAEDIIIYAGQKIKDGGQTIQNKAQEAGREGGRT